MEKVEVIQSEYRDRIGSNRSDVKILEYLNKLSIGEQYNQMYNFDQIFYNCSILRPIGINTDQLVIDCDIVSQIRRSVDIFSLRFTLFHQNPEESNDKFEIKNNIFSEVSAFLVEIWVRANISYAKVFVHSRNQLLIQDSLETSAKLKYMHGGHNIIQYKKQIIKSLPKPYETNCFDYYSIGFYSKEDCIQKCRIEELKQMFEGWPGTYYSHNEDDNHRYIYWVWHKYEESNYTTDLNISQKCKRMCDLGNE
jgi:hypothetical protein